MSTYRKFLTLTTSFLMLVGVTCNSRAASIFEFYDACKIFFDVNQPVISQAGRAMKAAIKDNNPYAVTLDDESILILRVLSREINKSEARKDTHYTALVEYFISRSTKGSAEGGGVNIEVMASRNNSGVCRGIGEPTEEMRLKADMLCIEMLKNPRILDAIATVNNMTVSSEISQNPKHLAQSQPSYMSSYPEKKKSKQSECCVVL